MKDLIEPLIFPPGVTLLLGLAGLLLWPRRRAALALCSLGFLTLYFSSLPFVAHELMKSLQIYPALSEQDIARHQGEAIVILGGGRSTAAPEYGGDTVSRFSLERLRYGARLARQTKLPVVVSGGSVYGEPVPEADLIADALTKELAVPVSWTEETSANTQENARYTAFRLKKQGMKRIYLVTHAWHMRRAAAAFKREGITVIPAPTGFITAGPHIQGLRAWLPTASALEVTRIALHEKLGYWWYGVKDR